MRTYASQYQAAWAWIFLVLCWIQLAVSLSPSSEIEEKRPDRQREHPLSRIVVPGASKQGINDSGESENHPRDEPKERSSSFSADRALATYAPDVASGIHRSGIGRVGDGGVVLQQRYIHDWEVADYVLLATVDGKLYATDRKTGVTRWEIFTNNPVVKTISHRANTSDPLQDWIPDDNVVWIVEPTDGGQMFFYSPEGGLKVVS